MSDRKRCEPYGNLATAKVLVIGHDPKLQTGSAQAEYAFFLEYMDGRELLTSADRSKHHFAFMTYAYIKNLTGHLAILDEIYFTNLCNEFLQRRSTTKEVIYICDKIACHGVREIKSIVDKGSFKVVVPMSQQVFYHLIRTNFITDDPHGNLKQSLQKLQPDPNLADEGIYKPVSESPFLKVCGCKYWHYDIPVVPILHVKLWLQAGKVYDTYKPYMRNAARNIKEALRGKATK